MGMVITVPILRAGDVMNIRRSWACPDRQLPEPLVYLYWRVDPGPDVVVKEVRYGSASVTGSEPWTIVWVTVEVPDGSVYPIEFQTQNPKEFAAKRPLTDADYRRVAGEIRKAGISPDDLAKLHATRMAEAEPDTGVTP